MQLGESRVGRAARREISIRAQLSLIPTSGPRPLHASINGKVVRIEIQAGSRRGAAGLSLHPGLRVPVAWVSPERSQSSSGRHRPDPDFGETRGLAPAKSTCYRIKPLPAGWAECPGPFSRAASRQFVDKRPNPRYNCCCIKIRAIRDQKCQGSSVHDNTTVPRSTGKRCQAQNSDKAGRRQCGRGFRWRKYPAAAS